MKTSLIQTHEVNNMWNEPSKIRLACIPLLYETESIPTKDKLIYMHFFIGGSDWYICEYDGEDIFFGYAILNNDLENGEWGYISFSELKEISVMGFEVDCELEEHWPPTPVSHIAKIKFKET